MTGMSLLKLDPKKDIACSLSDHLLRGTSATLSGEYTSKLHGQELRFPPNSQLN